MFISAIKAANRDNRLSFMKTLNKFPKGSCGDASLLLGKYLIENGFEPKYKNGKNGKYEGNDVKSHAWLELNDIIIDITARQFDQNNNLENCYYIGKINDFYKSFKNPEENYIDFSRYDRTTCDNLNNAYNVVKEYIDVK